MKSISTKIITLFVVLSMIILLSLSQSVFAASKSVSKVKNVKVKTKTTSSITVKWKRNPYVTGYRVYMKKRKKFKIY